MSEFRPVVIVPAYSNAGTVAAVVDGAKAHVSDVIVVDDGSTDDTQELLAARSDMDYIRLPQNRGKGHALRKGFERAVEKGFTHAITIDADGQHQPSDIPLFLAAAKEKPQTLFIGNRTIPMEGHAGQPVRSRFGARFGTFWYHFHTGIRIHDTQCGFRVYPLAAIAPLACRSDRYEYEIEVLIKAAWARVPVEQIDIHLYYQPRAERVSHFRPLRDFGRIRGRRRR